MNDKIKLFDSLPAGVILGINANYHYYIGIILKCFQKLEKKHSPKSDKDIIIRFPWKKIGNQQ